MLLVVWGSITIVFFLSRILPADPALTLSGPHPPPEVIEATRHRLGLDKPLWHQYSAYLLGLARGDLGRSAVTGHDVVHELATRLPATLELITVALALAVGAALLFAVAAAGKPGGWIDRTADAIALSRTAVPTFFAGVLCVWLFYTVLEIAPAPIGRLPLHIMPPTRVTGLLLVDSVLAGRGDVFRAALAHVLFPGMTLASGLFPPLLRVLRGNIRYALQSDSLLALRFTPIGNGRLWLRYILPLAVVPTLTLLAASFGSLVGGTVVIEHIFAWNGLGSYVLDGIDAGDYFVVQGVVLVSAVAYAVAFFAVDLLAWTIDRRTLEEGDEDQR